MSSLPSYMGLGLYDHMTFSQVYLGEQYVNNPTLSDVTFLIEGMIWFLYDFIQMTNTLVNVYIYCLLSHWCGVLKLIGKIIGSHGSFYIIRQKVLCPQNLSPSFIRCISCNVRWWIQGEHCFNEFLNIFPMSLLIYYVI